jgi:hypothetical protein
VDVPPPARPVAADADLGNAPPSPPASPPAPGDDVSGRLVALESAVADLARRVDALAASSEAAVSAAVAREVQGVAADLRHTVSELGRLLVRDLGKLSKILAEHRDTILAEVRGPGRSPAAEPAPAVEAGEPAPGGEGLDAAAADAALATPGNSAADAAEDGPEPSGDQDAERSWLRRRRPS